MSRKKLAKILLSVLVVVSTLVSVVVDWNASHVFNPDWHPHGRFHDVMLLSLLVGLVPILLWLLWRDSSEPEVAIKVREEQKNKIPAFMVNLPLPTVICAVSRLVGILFLGRTLTTAILVIFWGSFYVNLLIPGTSPAANLEELPPNLLGILLYPNMVVAAIIIILALIGYWLYYSSNNENREL